MPFTCGHQKRRYYRVKLLIESGPGVSFRLFFILMKKLLLTLLLGFTCFAAHSQQVVWEHTVVNPDSSGNIYTYPLEYVTLPDGGFAAVFTGLPAARVARYDSSGNEIWNEPLPANLNLQTFMHALLKIVPGGLLVGLQQYDTDTVRLALAKLNWQGAVQWVTTIPTGRNFNSPCDLYIRSANEYIIMAGGRNSNQVLGNGGGDKFVVIATDSLGNTLWRKIYLDPLLTICYPKNIFRDRQSGYMFTGTTGTNGNWFPRIIKTDATGNILQNELLNIPPAGFNYNTYHSNSTLVSDGGVVFSGFNFGSDHSQRYIQVAKVDTALNVLWTVTHNEPGGSLEKSQVIEMADSSILMVTQQLNGDKIILVRISAQGQLLDTTYVPVTTNVPVANINLLGRLLNAFLLPDSSLFYGGESFIAKIANVGLPMPPQQFEEPPVGLPEQLELLTTALGAAYPNPANSTVTIPYRLPEGATAATIEIAEVATGRLVQRITLDLTAEQAELNVAAQAAGVYTYTLVVDGVPAGTKKLVIIK